jgi:hypothetical protein
VVATFAPFNMSYSPCADAFVTAAGAKTGGRPHPFRGLSTDAYRAGYPPR